MLKSKNLTPYHSVYLTTHLLEAQQFDRVFTLINRDWVDAQFEFSRSHKAALNDFRIAFDIATTNQSYFSEIPKIAILQSVVRDMSYAVPAKAIEALALTGEFERAEAWANLLDDEDYFDSQLLLIKVMREKNVDTSEMMRVMNNLLFTLHQLGPQWSEDIRMFPELDQLNALHKIVIFPASAEWEGTTPEKVDIARIPLDATIRLSEEMHACNLISFVNDIRHDFWQLYDQLMIRLAAEYHAIAGNVPVARGILNALKSPDEVSSNYKDDPTNAAKYREAVAWGALGEFDKARQQIDAIPNPQYLSVGCRLLAAHAARLENFTLALDYLKQIKDPYDLDPAIEAVVWEFSEHPDPHFATKLLEICEQRNLQRLMALVYASIGDRKQAERCLKPLSDDEETVSWFVSVAHQAKFDKKDQRKFFKLLHKKLVRVLGEDWIQIDHEFITDLIRIMLRWGLIERIVDEIFKAPSEASFYIAMRVIEALGTEEMIDDIDYICQIFTDDLAKSDLLLRAVLFLGLNQSHDLTHEVFAMAKPFLDTLPQEELAELDIETVAETLLDNELIEDAKLLLKHISNQSDVRAHYAVAFARAGHMDELQKQLDLIQPLAKPVTYLGSLCTVLCRIIVNLVQHGLLDAAQKRLALVDNIVKQVPPEKLLFHLVVNTNYALAQATVGKVERAIDVATSIGQLEVYELMGMSYRYPPDTLLAILLNQIETLCEIACLRDKVAIEQRKRCAQEAKLRAQALDAQNVGERGIAITSKALVMTDSTDEACQIVGEQWFAKLEIISAAIEMSDFETTTRLQKELREFLESDLWVIEQKRYGRYLTVEENFAAQDETRLVNALLLLSEAKLAYEDNDSVTALEKLRDAESQLNALLKMAIPEIVCYLQVAGMFKRCGDTKTTYNIMDRLLGEVARLPISIRYDALLQITKQYELMGDHANARQLWLDVIAYAMTKDPDHVCGALRYGIVHLPKTIEGLNQVSLFDNLMTMISQLEFITA